MERESPSNKFSFINIYFSDNCKENSAWVRKFYKFKNGSVSKKFSPRVFSVIYKIQRKMYILHVYLHKTLLSNIFRNDRDKIYYPFLKNFAFQIPCICSLENSDEAFL